MSDIDEDLKQLLNQLDEPDVSTDASSVDNNTAMEPLRPIEEKRIVEPIEVNDQPVVDIARYLDKMEGVADEVLQACRSDRREAQEVINMLRGQCEQAHSKNQPPARMYVDGLVKSVEVKANINTNAVKVMEGVAKMIAATRAGLNIQNNNVNVSSAELDEILSTTEISGELD